MERIAPIFAVYDLDAAREHYQRLGFAVRAYAGGGYGFASWHGVEIHLGVVPDDDHCTSAAYLFVDDAPGGDERVGSTVDEQLDGVSAPVRVGQIPKRQVARQLIGRQIGRHELTPVIEATGGEIPGLRPRTRSQPFKR
jgi:hypothetical protein